MIYLAAPAAPTYAWRVASLDFEELVENFYAPLYRFALSLARQESEAGDLVQQTFFLWASKGHQLRDASKVKTWLLTSLYREFLGRKRQQDRFVDAENNAEAISAQTVPASVVNQLDGDIVQQALFALEEIYRAPLALFYLEQLSYKEIAAALELPIGTVMSRISRGKEKLRRALADGIGLTPESGGGTAHD